MNARTAHAGRTGRTVRTVAAAFLIGLTLSLVAPRSAYACPFCADQVEQKSKDGSAGNPSSAYNYSIFAMIGILGAVGLGLGRLMFIVVKQADAESQAQVSAAEARAAARATSPHDTNGLGGAKPAATA